MSASKEWTEWHLTPRGWEIGSERVDSAGITERVPPSDRVLTCQYREDLPSMYSKLDRATTELWRHADSARIQSLLEQFGPCPEHL